MSELSLEALHGLTERDLKLLVRELLEAEDTQFVSASQPATSAGVVSSEQEAGPLLVREASETALVEAHRSGRSPLAGMSLQRAAMRASTFGASRAVVFLTGTLDADRQAALADVLAEVDRGTGVEVRLVDAQELLRRLQPHTELTRKYFPSEREAQEAADEQNIPQLIVRAANVVAHKPAATPIRAGGNVLRLVWTTGAVLVLIWVPVEVDPLTARWIGGIGLGLIALGVSLAQLFRPDVEYRAYLADSVMDALIPVKDEMAVRRDLTAGRYGNGPAGLALDTLKRLPSALVRASTQTALLLFLVTCSLSYLLLWAVDAQTCAEATGACKGAFAGLPEQARLGDFMNLAVHAAFFEVPDNIKPASRLARGLLGAEFVSSAVLLGSYAAFFGFTGVQQSNAR